MSRKAQSRGERIAELERKLVSAEKDKKALEGTVEELRKQMGWVRNLEVDHQATLRRLLFELDSTALLSDANQAIRSDNTKVSGGGVVSAFDPRSVYAYNFLVRVMDHLERVTGEVATWNHTTPAVSNPRPRCRNCHRPIDLLVDRFCTVCGIDLIPGDA